MERDGIIVNNRRKELIEQYKQMKTDMGIFWIRSKTSDKCFLETSQNIKGKLNSTIFQLDAGSHSNKELQKEWKEFGQAQFNIEVLELLKYDKDETKTDYTEELAILKLVWEDKLQAEKIALYKKRVER